MRKTLFDLIGQEQKNVMLANAQREFALHIEVNRRVGQFQKKFIFTKTAKTAGTSIELYFEPYCVPEGLWYSSHARDEYVGDTGIVGYRGTNPRGKTWFNHMSASRIRQLIGDDVWNSYYKFCVIRNPFDLLVSAFHHNERQRSEPLSFESLKYKIRQLGHRPQGTYDVERFRH